MEQNSYKERFEIKDDETAHRTYMLAQMAAYRARDLGEDVRDLRAAMARLQRIVIAIIAVCVILIIAMCVQAGAGYFDAAENRKTAAHQMAEAARELGYGEDSAIITEAKAHYNAAQDEIDTELDMLGRVVYFEAGSYWISDRHQQLVACVVLNRCADSRFPATIKDNVYKRGQYSCASKLYTISREKIPARCFDNAKAAAYGAVECPTGVIYQAQFKQGRGTYERIGNTYFCY